MGIHYYFTFNFGFSNKNFFKIIDDLIDRGIITNLHSGSLDFSSNTFKSQEDTKKSFWVSTLKFLKNYFDLSDNKFKPQINKRLETINSLPLKERLRKLIELNPFRVMLVIKTEWADYSPRVAVYYNHSSIYTGFSPNHIDDPECRDYPQKEANYMLKLFKFKKSFWVQDIKKTDLLYDDVEKPLDKRLTFSKLYALECNKEEQKRINIIPK